MDAGLGMRLGLCLVYFDVANVGAIIHGAFNLEATLTEFLRTGDYRELAEGVSASSGLKFSKFNIAQR
jgi:hypothetical protein